MNPFNLPSICTFLFITFCFSAFSQIHLLKDFVPGGDGSDPLIHGEVNGKLFFSARSPEFGNEFWLSDGTEEGTVCLDINPGSGDGTVYLHDNDEENQISFAYKLNNKFLFVAHRPDIGNELWVTDGTTAGTRLLLETISGTEGIPRFSRTIFISNENRVFFSLDFDEYSFKKLWVTDGTIAGTSLVKDFGSGEISYYPLEATSLDGKIFFSADDGLNGFELWVSDGSSNGTSMVENINSDGSSSPEELFVLGNKVLFTAINQESNRELWVSKGTNLTTYKLKEINSSNDLGSSPFFTHNAHSKEIGKCYFSAYDDVNGRELWVTDGTQNGTFLVENINDRDDNSHPGNFTFFKNEIYFSASSKLYGQELFKVNPNNNEVQLVKDILHGSYGSQIAYLIKLETPIVERIIFQADLPDFGDELFYTDGIETDILKDIQSGQNSSFAGFFLKRENVLFSDKLYFPSSDGINGLELWVTDGTTIGTNIVFDLASNSTSSNPDNFVILNDKFFFSANNIENGREIFYYQENTLELEGVYFNGDYYPSIDKIHVNVSGGATGDSFSEICQSDESAFTLNISSLCRGQVSIDYVSTDTLPDPLGGDCCFFNHNYTIKDNCGNLLNSIIQTNSKKLFFNNFKFLPNGEDADSYCKEGSQVLRNADGAFVQSGDTIRIDCHERLEDYDSLIACGSGNCNGGSSGKFRRARRFFTPDNCYRETWEWGIDDFTGEMITLTFEFEDCATNADITENPIPTNTYFAEQNITSNGQLANDASVRFIAGNSITLNAGFSTGQANNFLAQIQSVSNCNAGTNSRSTTEESIQSSENSTAMTITPNPATNTVNITYSLSKNTKSSEINLLNANGQYLQKIQLSADQKSLELPLNQWNAGLYFLQLRSNTEVLTKKLLILR